MQQSHYETKITSRKGIKMNQNEPKNGNSALGDISILTPSQKREQERLRKEKEAKEAAKRENRRIIAEKRKANEAHMKRLAIIECLIVPAIFGLSGLVVFVLGILAASMLFAMYGLFLLVIGIVWGAIAVSKNK